MGRSSNSKKSGAHKGSSQRDAAAVPATSQPEGKKRKLKGPDVRPSEQARPSKSRAQGGAAEVHRNGAQADGVASVKAGNKSFVDGLFAKAVTQAGPAPGAKRPPDAHTRAAEKRSSKASKVRPSGCKDDLFGEEARARAKTEEGWNVYTEAELKLGGAGGGTDMCPFDCDCCF